MKLVAATNQTKSRKLWGAWPEDKAFHQTRRDLQVPVGESFGKQEGAKCRSDFVSGHLLLGLSNSSFHQPRQFVWAVVVVVAAAAAVVAEVAVAVVVVVVNMVILTSSNDTNERKNDSTRYLTATTTMMMIMAIVMRMMKTKVVPICIYIYIIYIWEWVSQWWYITFVWDQLSCWSYFMLDLIHDFTWFHTCVCSIFSPDYLNGINSRHGRCAISRFDTYRIQVEKLRHEALRWKQRRKVLKGSLRLDIHTTILWGFPINDYWMKDDRHQYKEVRPILHLDVSLVSKPRCTEKCTTCSDVYIWSWAPISCWGGMWRFTLQ